MNFGSLEAYFFVVKLIVKNIKKGAKGGVALILAKVFDKIICHVPCGYGLSLFCSGLT